MVKRLESMVNVRLAMIQKKPKSYVLDKYLTYLHEYDNMENKGIREKIEHRDLFHRYLRYMEMAKE